MSNTITLEPSSSAAHRITLRSGPKNFATIGYGIILFNIVLFFGILASRVESFSLLLTFTLIPIILFVFILKLFIWQLFGTETIDIKKKTITIRYDYKYIYKPWEKEYVLSSPNIAYRTLSNGILDYEQLSKLEKPERTKLLFQLEDDKSYSSSFAVMSNDMPDIASLVFNNSKSRKSKK